LDEVEHIEQCKLVLKMINQIKCIICLSERLYNNKEGEESYEETETSVTGVHAGRRTALSGCGSTTIDLNKYVTIEAEGYIPWER